MHFGLRVTDLDRSLAFYRAVGYEIVGEVPETPLGHLTMVRLPGDEFVTIELVHNPGQGEMAARGGLSHFVIKIESMTTTVAHLVDHGIDVETPTSPGGPEDFLTTWITDPDGTRIELVQWPAGHVEGVSQADWPS
ncbi:MAG TPA: VOC family protein [Acidimicrobiales bacterium]|nr:VOC family protein [Acidimicrobiales bacterium]